MKLRDELRKSLQAQEKARIDAEQQHQAIENQVQLLKAEIAALQKQLHDARMEQQRLRATSADACEHLRREYERLEAEKAAQTADEQTKREELRKSLEETNAKLVDLQ